jgi:septal ring factor EnvC (AmiA/AmiB activator)
MTVAAAAAAACPVWAQQPATVENAVSRKESALQSGQYRAGQAYRELQDARYRTKLAEQEVLNAEEAYRRAQQQTAELKRQLEEAKKALAAAKAQEAEAQRRYERELDAVDRIRRNSPSR